MQREGLFAKRLNFNSKGVVCIIQGGTCQQILKPNAYLPKNAKQLHVLDKRLGCLKKLQTGITWIPLHAFNSPFAFESKVLVSDI